MLLKYDNYYYFFCILTITIWQLLTSMTITISTFAYLAIILSFLTKAQLTFIFFFIFLWQKKKKTRRCSMIKSEVIKDHIWERLFAIVIVRLIASCNLVLVLKITKNIALYIFSARGRLKLKIRRQSGSLSLSRND